MEKKKTIQIKNRYTDEVIFEYEGESLVEADLVGANLWEADLSGADLRGANLWEADLSGADLRGANLSEADLWRANLSGADLNAIFYKTKLTAKQKSEIVESDLFEVVDDSTSQNEICELCDDNAMIKESRFCYDCALKYKKGLHEGYDLGYIQSLRDNKIDIFSLFNQSPQRENTINCDFPSSCCRVHNLGSEDTQNQIRKNEVCVYCAGHNFLHRAGCKRFKPKWQNQ